MDEQPSAELKINTSSTLETALITSKELDNAIFSFKRGKASGPDDINPEHLIYLGSLKDGLHKGKGNNPGDPKNYRGITLTSTLCKLLELVLKPRIESSLSKCDIPDELQFGFQKGHSCLLTSCCLELVLELNTLSRKPTYVALLDAEKAFDRHPAWHLGDVVVQTASLHPHLGIIKSSIRRDPTEDIIAKGLKTFYALTGSGAYTGGLLPNHSATLWKVYCIPRMLYGVAIMTLTKGMKRRLDQAQQQLFKQILGIPKTAADESVLTGLIPLSTQVDQEKLLLIGQLLNLPHDRFEYRTFLHALSSQTTSIKAWQDTLSRYKLPDLHSLILQPVPYSQWKKLVKCAGRPSCKTEKKANA
ncbi:uncharacterized protein LOC121417614 [Lytechinus variegatus]|uniref:uncharacterized protein LOC121417614 n=1 Tax=Lytechinus variegatus TaxID=7654 RepID=UPI001BB2CEE7|nr:uncharacterized protein LOC121417614 [Lytechinus variegatus]